MLVDDIVWSEKYRPKTIEECIIPKQLKTTFTALVNENKIPNLILTGPAGVGKTTVAKAMLDELGCSWLFINASKDGNIDTLRNKIQQFASSLSLDGNRKFVILDEGDGLTVATQPALRSFMDEYSKNCGFILTCNYLNKIIEPLRSRFSVIHFNIPKEEKQTLAVEFFKRISAILEKENVKFDKKAVATVVEKYFPDFRKTLNELQLYGATGEIDSGILSTFLNFGDLIKHLKSKNYAEMRKWLVENNHIDSVSIFRTLYDSAKEVLEKDSIPSLVLILGEYSYRDAMVADKEINLAAMMTQIMAECKFR